MTSLAHSHAAVLYRDVMQAICRFLPLRDLYAVSHTCRAWAAFVEQFPPQNKRVMDVSPHLFRMSLSGVTRHIAHADLFHTPESKSVLLLDHYFHDLVAFLPHLTGLRCNMSLVFDDTTMTTFTPFARLRSFAVRLHAPARIQEHARMKNGWKRASKWTAWISHTMPELDTLEIGIQQLFDMQPGVFQVMRPMQRLHSFAWYQFGVNFSTASAFQSWGKPSIDACIRALPALTSVSINDGKLSLHDIEMWSKSTIAPKLQFFEMKHQCPDAKSLQLFPNLTTLEYECEDIECFVGLLPMVHLQTLRIDVTYINATADQLIAALLRLPCSLHTLGIKDAFYHPMHLTNDHLAALGKKWPHLTSFVGHQLGPLVDASLRAHMPHLAHFELK
jgi:hypothetical protein